MRWLGLIVGVLFVSGCAPSSSSRDAWVWGHGGLLLDARQQRLDAVSQPLFARCLSQPVTVQVLNSDAVAAYCWPEGHLFVTRRLADLMDDEELAAVVAHEMGHLLDNGHRQSILLLNGCESEPDAESRADLFARELLSANGYPTGSMKRALEKVIQAGGLSPSCRTAFDMRITKLMALDNQAR